MTVLKMRDEAAHECREGLMGNNERTIHWCEKHQPSGGHMNCVMCGLEEMSSALGRIDALVDPGAKPDQAGYFVAMYDLDCNPEGVVDRVRTLINTQRVLIDTQATEIQRLRCDRGVDKASVEDCLVCGGKGWSASDETYMQMQGESCTACAGTGRIRR